MLEQDTKKVSEGGWGWLVAIATGVQMVLVIGTGISAPFVFGQFLEDLGLGTRGLTIYCSIVASALSFTGLVVNRMFSKFSCREIQMQATFIFVFVQLLAAFATSEVHLFLAAPVLGFTSGLMMSAGIYMINQYFEKKRTMAMSLSQLVTGIIATLYVMLSQYLVEKYGFRGAQIILAGIGSHGFIVALIYRKVPKYRENKLETNESADINAINEDGPFLPIVIKKQGCKDCEVKSPTTELVLSLEDNIHLSSNYNNVIHAAKEVNDRVDYDSKIKLNVTDLKSLEKGEDNKISNTYYFEETVTSDMKKKSNNNNALPLTWNIKRFKTTISDFLDLSLLKDLSLVNSLVGISANLFVDLNFNFILPLLLFFMNFTRLEAAVFMSIIGAADLLGRGAMIIIGAYCNFKNKTLFIIGAIMAALARLCFIFFRQYTTLLVLNCIACFFKGVMFITSALVIADSCSLERFPAAFGLQNVIMGTMNIIFGPIIGILRDVTGSFNICIIIGTIISGVTILAWIIEILKEKYTKTNPLDNQNNRVLHVQ